MKTSHQVLMLLRGRFHSVKFASPKCVICALSSEGEFSDYCSHCLLNDGSDIHRFCNGRWYCHESCLKAVNMPWQSRISQAGGGVNLLLPPAKRSLRRLCFYTCLSVHRGVPGQVPPLGQVPPPPAGTPPRGGTSPLGRYNPRAGTPPWAGTPSPEQCMLGDTGNKRAVRILLECILFLVWPIFPKTA